MGVGNHEAELCDHVHGCTPDEESNMLKAWRMFEGAGCVCHRAQNCLKGQLNSAFCDGVNLLTYSDLYAVHCDVGHLSMMKIKPP